MIHKRGSGNRVVGSIVKDAVKDVVRDLVEDVSSVATKER
jgi:hypothetical protein